MCHSVNLLTSNLFQVGTVTRSDPWKNKQRNYKLLCLDQMHMEYAFNLYQQCLELKPYLLLATENNTCNRRRFRSAGMILDTSLELEAPCIHPESNSFCLPLMLCEIFSFYGLIFDLFSDLFFPPYTPEKQPHLHYFKNTCLERGN